MRAAIFYTPAADHPLTKAAALWLGRDAYTGQTWPIAARAGEAIDMAQITAEPRRYGFHATMKAPFRIALDRNLAGLDSAVANFCRSAEATGAINLQLQRIGSFFALTSSNAAATALAGSIVTSFEPFRAPLQPHELARRKSASLTPAQERNLAQWGYPYVFDEYRFHMTLTGPIAPPQRDAVLAVLERRFGALINDPIEIDAIALFVQAQPGADFLVRARYPLRGRRS